MSKTAAFQDLILGPFKGDQEVWRWLYTELRSAILTGKLKPGAKLPSTRSVASQYGLSRGTVVVAFHQLQADGAMSRRSTFFQLSYGRELRQECTAVRATYVTPANQFPLSTVMSANRRVELLSWAVRAGAWIIEDDYDAEYSYSGKPTASLHSLDTSGSVIYVGTFTRTLFNALRLGFIVLPERLVGAFEIARSFIDRHPATLDQAVLAEFITEGHFGYHMQKMRQAYSARLQTLKEASERQLPHLLEIENVATGMKTIGWIKTAAADTTIAQRAEHFGLEVLPVSAFVSQNTQRPGLLLGFASSDASEIERGVSVLRTVLSSVSAVP